MIEQLAFETDSVNERSSARLEWQSRDLAELWQALCAGTWKFRELFDSDSRCYAMIERVQPASARPVRERCVSVLGPLLLGQSQKAVAFDLNVSPSTVASAAKEGLHAMGLKRLGSRAPILLAMAACAALLPRRSPVLARFTRVETDEHGALLVSMARPDVHFPAHLSPAEVAVIRQHLSGVTHRQIAESRGTVPRTVANQLATTFYKLGVSGRAALTAHLILLAPEFCETVTAGSDASPMS